MIKKSIIVSVAVVVLLVLNGCTTGGSFLALNLTNVELFDSGTRLVARDVAGTSEAGYLFGFSYSTGNMASTFALARVNGTATLYDSAIKDLWKNFEAKYGSTEGKKLALVNIRYDSDMLNLLVYTQTKLYINADVVEFTE